MLRRDYRGAAGGDPPRSLQRRLGRSCHRRYWATAPPGPQAPLPQRDCGGRRGTTVRKRQGAQSGEGPGGARQAPPTASRRTPTTPPRRRKSVSPYPPWRPRVLRPEHLCTFFFTPGRLRTFLSLRPVPESRSVRESPRFHLL
ncbi:hypothetical protein mRhiFer1_010270 [Rhinolophus ferrumequinum]|uniref:Uncharacterized protein n=1 Tax=Rhinolophus ferrumequinum TaxID=59479 RepID=A0A7J7X5D4_RHIFE|nr:hypothetical protein mRhiFer1_010270 [Rhinolophus ferrumequinum]